MRAQQVVLQLALELRRHDGVDQLTEPGVDPVDGLLGLAPLLDALVGLRDLLKLLLVQLDSLSLDRDAVDIVDGEILTCNPYHFFETPSEC